MAFIVIVSNRVLSVWPTTVYTYSVGLTQKENVANLYNICLITNILDVFIVIVSNHSHLNKMSM